MSAQLIMKLKSIAAAKEGAEQAPTFWGKFLAVTPVVMTVVATLLAALANGEMTRAQYARALAAQQQSKVGDQWNFFQAKRLRGSILRADLQVLGATIDVLPLKSADVATALKAEGQAVPPDEILQSLVRPEGAAFPAPPGVDVPAIKQALEAVAAGREDDEVTNIVGSIPATALTTALRAVEDFTRKFDASITLTNQAIDRLERDLAGALARTPDSVRPVWRAFTAAKMRFDASRYDAEAKFNRSVAEILELQVRQSNILAAHHYRRSRHFFYGMLVAQTAVMLSTLAMAARQKTLLWGFAAGIGLIASAFGVYVYLFI